MLAKRELQADNIRLVGLDELLPETPNAVAIRLPDARHVVASFTEPPSDAAVVARRLTMLASTFVDALGGPPSTRSRPPVASTLHEELRALSARARANDVVVIDVDSPVIWGCASGRGQPRAQTGVLLRDVSDRAGPPSSSSTSDESILIGDRSTTRRKSRSTIHESADESTHMLSDGADDDDDEPPLTRRTIGSIRRLPELDHLHKGRHLRRVQADGPYYLALSFSGIYLLCLVFDAPFDELRAERAAQESLTRIERLVLALPPLDPEPQPMGGVISLHRRRR